MIKKLLIIGAMFMLYLTAVNSFAAGARIDISGVQNKITLTPGKKSQHCTLMNPSWVKPESKQKQMLYFTTPHLTTKAQSFEITFIPQQSGMIKINLSGPYHKPSKPCESVYFQKVEIIAGATIKNPNFNNNNPNGTLAGWFFNDLSRIPPLMKLHNGIAELKVSYDQPLHQYITVKKGVAITIKITAKKYSQK